MPGAELKHFTINQNTNREASEAWEYWKHHGVNISDKICKLIIQERKQEQFIEMGGPATTPNDVFLQQAEYENNFITPLDNIPIAKLHEQDLTEMELNPLNEEQAIELVNKIRVSKNMIHKNETFVTDFFNVVDVYDERVRKKVPTIQNTSTTQTQRAGQRSIREVTTRTITEIARRERKAGAYNHTRAGSR